MFTACASSQKRLVIIMWRVSLLDLKRFTVSYTDLWDTENRGRSILSEQRKYELGGRRYEQRLSTAITDHPHKHISSAKRRP